MKVKVWGARGSVPAPGPEMNRYGGNTSCVQVTFRDGSQLILDAGTGIRTLGLELADAPKVGILLTHLHLDHIQGLMFFPPCFRSDAEITIWGPSSPEASLEDRIARYISAPLSPVEVRELPCSVAFRDAPATEWRIGDVLIRAEAVTHRGPTLGYRITDGDTTLCYIPDHEPALGAPLAQVDERVDLRLRPRQRRRPADPRLPVHGRGVPGARRLGPLRPGGHADVRQPRRRLPGTALPPRPAAHGRDARLDRAARSSALGRAGPRRRHDPACAGGHRDRL